MIHEDPTGFRVLKNDTVLGWWSCHECPVRRCDCHDKAIKAMKRAGAPARLETLDGVPLASMKPAAYSGKNVPMLSLAEHRAQPRACHSVDEAIETGIDLDDPTDEPGDDVADVEEVEAAE